MVAMDEYSLRRLARHLRDIIQYYEDKIVLLEPGSELHALLTRARNEARDTLTWVTSATPKH